MKKVSSWWLPDNEQHLIKYIERDDGYQRSHRKHALSFVQNFRRAVDIGAHVGLWARDLCDLFEFVYAFEPIPEHRECFHKNVKNRNYELYDCALGNRESTAQMVFDSTNTGHTRIATNKEKDQVYRVVNIASLDSFNLDDIDFMKLDCEGYELFALQGAEATIKRCRPVINIEVKPKFKFYDVSAFAAGDYLKNLGMVELGHKGSEFVYGWS